MFEKLYLPTTASSGARNLYSKLYSERVLFKPSTT